MKTSHLLIVLTMIATLSMVSCKNNKKTESQEPTLEEVKGMKQALADTVLAKIDEFAEQYCNANTGIFENMKLTDKEKMVKPDYLLNPLVADNLVTKSQKISALALYVTDIAVCKVYDMPYDELKESAIKLAADLNVPFDMEYTTGNEPVSEKIKTTYDTCKERGDLALFWQFEYAFVTECIYLLSQNPELFLSKITDEQWQSWAVVKQTGLAAIDELAKYDEEMAQVMEFRKKNGIVASDEEINRMNQSIDAARQYYIANNNRYAAWRNALLQ